MAVAKVGTTIGLAGAIVAPAGNPQTVAVPTGGYPVGTIITAFGITNDGISTITDAKGNAWNRRLGAVTQGQVPTRCFLWDCYVRTALLAGDLISVTRFSQNWFGFAVQGWSGCDPGQWFDGACDPFAFTTTTPTTNPLTTTAAGNAIIGVFANGNGGNSAATQITTPGSGYTNETGYSSGGPEGWVGIDWESKIAGAAGSEAAACTYGSAPSTSYSGCFVAAYGAHVASSVGVN